MPKNFNILRFHQILYFILGLLCETVFSLKTSLMVTLVALMKKHVCTVVTGGWCAGEVGRTAGAARYIDADGRRYSHRDTT